MTGRLARKKAEIRGKKKDERKEASNTTRKEKRVEVTAYRGKDTRNFPEPRLGNSSEWVKHNVRGKDPLQGQKKEEGTKSNQMCFG